MRHHLLAGHAAAGGDPSPPRSGLDRLLPLVSIATMAFTVPQVWAVWVRGDTGGVSLWSWGAYTAAACLWLVDGVRKQDPTIWAACIGWLLLDGAVFLGALLRH
jgi:hypothetical protein